MAPLENILPYGKGEKKEVQVKRMFDEVAHGYDQTNFILSLGFDRMWRNKTVKFLQKYNPKTILDIASGTGDLAILLSKRLKPEQVIGADLSEKMMEIGQTKATAQGVADLVRFEYQDCLSLTYSDQSFDAVTLAFGIRNFANIEKGLAEIYRVLKPGGQMAILELSIPDYFPMRTLYNIYTKLMVKIVCKVYSLSESAYTYLTASIKAMPQGKDMSRIITNQGFNKAKFRRFTFGVCTLYTAIK